MKNNLYCIYNSRKDTETEDTMQRLIITTTVTATIIDRTATGMGAGAGA